MDGHGWGRDWGFGIRKIRSSACREADGRHDLPLFRIPNSEFRIPALLELHLRHLAHLGAVGQQIGNQASFDSRNYGYRKLSDLIEATGLFDVRRQNPGVQVRDSRRR